MGLTAIAGGGKMSPNMFQRQRKGLLAKVHIARQQLGLTDDEYRACLQALKASSAAELSIAGLELLVDHFKKLGWRARNSLPKQSRLDALRGRAIEEARFLERGGRRMRGLVKSICGVDDLRFCTDPGKLLRLLKVLREYRKLEGMD